MTFNSEFKRIFSETFQSDGFKYCSKLDAFVKMLSEDLMAFFKAKPAPAWNKESKGFLLVIGVISTYCNSIDKKSILYASQDLRTFLPKDELVVSYEYTEATMEEILTEKAAHLRKILMPVFNKVFDLNSYIEYLKEYSIGRLANCDKFQGESLILIKSDNHDDFQKYFQLHLNKLYTQIDAGNAGEGYTKAMAYDDLFHGIIENIVYPRDKVYSNKDLYKEAMEEAEKRKKENMKKLYNYKVL